MVGNREDFLTTVKNAVAAGNRAGGASEHPKRGRTGYHGAGTDAVRRFAAEITAAGGTCTVVAERAAATAAVCQIVHNKSAKCALVGNGGVIDALPLQRQLKTAGVKVIAPHADRQELFAAEIGITGVDALIAETGSLVVRSAPAEPRSLSLLPPVHVAVAESEQILADLFDLFDRSGPIAEMPSCLTLITGPSKTGDIELRLVTGVHGPREVHVILIDAPAV